MVIALIVFGICILGNALALVGVIQRLVVLERNSTAPAEVQEGPPAWVAAKLSQTHTHHLVIVVDDSCSVCHRTVYQLGGLVASDPEISECVTILANRDVFESELAVLVDEDKHRRLHPGWAPVGLVFSSEGLAERIPVGSEDALVHAVHRLSILSSLSSRGNAKNGYPEAAGRES